MVALAVASVSSKCFVPIPETALRSWHREGHPMFEPPKNSGMAPRWGIVYYNAMWTRLLAAVRMCRRRTWVREDTEAMQVHTKLHQEFPWGDTLRNACLFSIWIPEPCYSNLNWNGNNLGRIRILNNASKADERSIEVRYFTCVCMFLKKFHVFGTD